MSKGIGVCVRKVRQAYLFNFINEVSQARPLHILKGLFLRIFIHSFSSDINMLHGSISECKHATPNFVFLFSATDTCLCQKPGNVCVTRSRQQARLTGTGTQGFLHRCNKTNERGH